MSEKDTIVFTHDFGDGVTATAVVAIHRPRAGESHIRSIEWSDEIGTSMEHLGQYIDWMNDINQKMADRWGIRLMHIYQVTPDVGTWRLYGYEPGGSPKFIDFMSELRKLESNGNGRRAAGGVSG